MQATIIGAGMYAPERVINNQYFNDLYKKDIDSFLRKERNIFERRWMRPGQTTSDLIVPAAQEALEHAGITASEVDLIIVATDTPDYLSPATAAVVQHKIGAKSAYAFDVNSACAGFITALETSKNYLLGNERMRHVLVVGAYGMSRFLNLDDYKTATVFADGAGALVLKRTHSQVPGILSTVLRADGSYHDAMGIYAGGTFKPCSSEVIQNREHLLQFPRKIPAEFNTGEWPPMVRALLDRAHLDISDVDHFFFTQININSINDTLNALGVSPAKAHNIMDRYGYTGSACVPMALADASRQGKLKEGQHCVLVASGGGIAMGAVALRWGACPKKA